MLSTDFVFRQQENLVGNQKCQAGFRPYLYSDQGDCRKEPQGDPLCTKTKINQNS